MVLLGGFEPPTLPNLGTCAGYKPGVLPLNYRSKSLINISDIWSSDNTITLILFNNIAESIFFLSFLIR